MSVGSTGLIFANPTWFWALCALIPLLVLRLRAHFTTRKQLPGLVSPRLQSQLISGKSQLQRWFVFFLHCLAYCSIVAALARPQMGFDEVETETEGRNLIIAIDTSRSMLANDLQPNRLSRAKLAAMDIVRSLPEDRIGLIAFAGRPFLQAPLTVDHEAILESIDQLDTEIIPRGGTNLAAAVKLARDTFEENETEQSALVLFSDGEALEGEAEAAEIREAAREAGMTILSIGVGTASGAIIPELDDRGQILPGEFVKDEAGQVVRTRLDPEALRALASDRGVYIHLGGRSSLTQVVSQIQSGIAISREESEASLRPIERFMWPLTIAFFCLLLSHLAPMLFRKSARSTGVATLQAAGRTAVGKTALLFCLLSYSAAAQADDPLFVGHENFRNQQYEQAIEVYEGALAEGVPRADEKRLQMGIGASAFRQGDYERAEDAFGQALVESKPGIQEQAHYNLGNTLFRKGEAALQSLQQPGAPDGLQTMTAPAEQIQATIETWESAIEHYESALSLNPQNHRAPHNIEVVKKKIEELKKQQEEQEKQEQEEQKQEEEQEKEDEEKEEENEEEQDQSENGESEQDEQEKNEQDQKEDSSGEGNEEEKPEEENGEQDPQEEDQEQNPEDGDQNEGEREENEQNEENGDESEQDEQEGNPQEQPSQPEEGGEEPQDGELKSNPNQPQPQEQQGQPGESQPMEERNPETGYSPSEARQLLRALADETEVRPILKPSRGERYKNW